MVRGSSEIDDGIGSTPPPRLKVRASTPSEFLHLTFPIRTFFSPLTTRDLGLCSFSPIDDDSTRPFHFILATSPHLTLATSPPRHLTTSPPHRPTPPNPTMPLPPTPTPTPTTAPTLALAPSALLRAATSSPPLPTSSSIPPIEPPLSTFPPSPLSPLDPPSLATPVRAHWYTNNPTVEVATYWLLVYCAVSFVGLGLWAVGRVVSFVCLSETVGGRVVRVLLWGGGGGGSVCCLGGVWCCGSGWAVCGARLCVVVGVFEAWFWGFGSWLASKGERGGG